MTNNCKRSHLIQFRLREKFSLEDWVRIGCVPSKFSNSKQLEDYINRCINNILVKTEYSGQIKKIISDHVAELQKLRLNNEERLLAYIYFNELTRICAVNLERKLDRWLFGLRGLVLYYLKPVFYKRKKKLTELMNNSSLHFDNYFDIVRKKAILLEEIRL